MVRNNTKKELAKKKMKKEEELQKKKKAAETSSSESDYEEEDEEEEEEEMSEEEYRKFLATLFPSKHITKSIKDGDKLKKKLLKQKETEEESDEDEELVARKSKKMVTRSSKNKKVVEEDEEETEYEDIDDEDDSDYVPSTDAEDEEKQINIVFTMDGYDDDGSDEEDDEDTEDEDEPVSDDEEEDPKDNNDLEVLAKLTELAKTTKNNKMVQKCIDVCEANLKETKARRERMDKKGKDKHLRIFKKLLKDKNTNNDFTFYEKMDIVEQRKIIKELREINKLTRVEKPYRMMLLESSIPVLHKAAAMKKVNALRYMEPGSGDYYKMKTWVDTFMKIPFNKYSALPLTIADGMDKCHDFMADAQKTLDEAVYGLDDAKMQIMQMLGQLLTNPQAIGTAIAIHGPPGTGKTSLIKDGISKILKRPFAFIPLGGAGDGSFLEGHSITYEGSVHGRIVQALIEAGTMDVVFLFDELDKLSDTARGKEIEGILTHLIDTTQNSEFHDKYFAEVKFDLSKCLFIVSYNDETLVNPILRDRMYRIQTKGYDEKEKTVIAKKYLLPKIRDQVKFNEGDIVINDDVLHHIIDTYCDKEQGVRNMKRCLEIIHTKLNLYRLVRPGSKLFEEAMSLKVEFPFNVDKRVVDTLIKKKKEENSASVLSMYM
jgi:ATP-dependent Lon protease